MTERKGIDLISQHSQQIGGVNVTFTVGRIRPTLPLDLPRTPRRVMMYVADAGQDCIQFKCRKCGHDTGWLVDERTVSENRRGMPCPKCNGGDGETARTEESK